MIELKVINQSDPLKRKAEKQTEQEEFSPMDPPDAYSPPNLEAIPYEEMHPFLQQLMDEHKTCIKGLDDFEAILLHIQEKGLDREVNGKLSQFFEFFDNNIVKHNQKEEKDLFPLLQQKLMESGEHGHGLTPVTAVDMLEDDHIKVIQLAAVVFNFFGLVMRLPDANSRLVVLDAALEQGKVLIEMLRLHIFREDNIVFVQAQQLISAEEFEAMAG
ncbi:MAG: hemerythrin domain-containing protein [Saprospiraceae bacterium]|nr:hemerythrin domain-containing protein [Saprospiraceae bacterium]MCF8248987.1 hemerythrin domain-containing protein [Saprospiraceae bacterium]MCF8279198.1 hemerythrin domain-containing protein [Bacteroidales bacterium]MCF8310881.1 hemerythrin domain-containing protein [Saprospiraceae bacterium]MCF8439531.1 hemerythrin domain-containing protein [Saprospiraceae bacterium]